MADDKLSVLPATTSVSDTDLAAIVSDPGGTPVTKKITIANLLAALMRKASNLSDLADKPTALANLGAAAAAHNHSGTYEPADATILKQASLAGSGVATTPAKSDHNHTGTYSPAAHDHSGVYEPADADLSAIAGLTPTNDDVVQRKSGAWANRSMAQVAADLPAMVGDTGSGGTKGLVPAPAAGDAAKFLKANGTWANPSTGSANTIDTASVWMDIFTVSRTGDTVVTYTAATAALATIIANTIIGRLARWTDSGGTNVRHGFVRNATASDVTVTINLYGEAFASGDTNFRLSVRETIRIADWYIPGEQVADATNPVGKRYWNETNRDWRILACSAYVGTAAAGAGAAMSYDIYDDGTGAFTTDPDLTTNASVLNSLPNNLVITGGSQITLRTPTAAGATNKASDLYVLMFYSLDDFWDAV